ncbi:MAG: uroporphyrinogen-III synthase, partial [Planctomycetes bacterium]|nr:uroporphyrinogen-III synthase [Planctomycetota bacterium]
MSRNSRTTRLPDCQTSRLSDYQTVLSGKTILLTRPREQAFQTAKKLRQLGAKVIIKPMIKIEKLKMDRNKLKVASESDCLVFTSQNGAETFLTALLRTYRLKSLQNIKIAVIGKETARTVQSYKLKVHYMPKSYTTESFGPFLVKKLKREATIFYPCADKHNRNFVKKLLRHGLKVTKCVVYKITKTRYPKFHIPYSSYIIFSSSMTVESFFDNLPINYQLSTNKLVCIGPVTAAKLRSYGYTPITAK